MTTEEVLTAMIAPDNSTIFVTMDGNSYKGNDAGNLVYVMPRHVTELTARGFTLATPTTLPAGDETTFDDGWVTS